MSLLQDHKWKCKYSPSDGDLLKNFYIPVLGCAMRYDRTTGYFSAETLTAASWGVEELVRNGGKMRLIVGCTLDEEEVAAIRRGEDLRGTVDASLLRSPFGRDSRQIRDGLELLAWMVAKGFLEVRVAVPCDPETREPCAGCALFHEKAGIVEDRNGDRLVFNGSLNETLAGWSRNWDTFHVFRSWKDDAEHLDADEESFQRLWHDREPTAVVLELGEAVRMQLLDFLPKDDELPVRLQEKNQDPKPVEEIWKFIREAPGREDGGERVGEATAAVTPWPHQVRAFTRMYGNWPPRLLIADEVGLGKTIQAGLLVRQAWLSGRARRILIMAPKAVLRQWQIELREKFNLNVPIYENQSLHWFPSPVYADMARRPVKDDAWHRQPLLLVSSYLMRRKERARQLLEEAEPWDLVILDEAHHARRKGGTAASRNTPNQLLRLMRGLKERTKGLVLLTATPMQVAPLEVWDLLDLLGLPKEWTAEAFLQFFELASRPSPDDKGLIFMAGLFRAMEQTYGVMSREEALRLDETKHAFMVGAVLEALHSGANTPLKQLNADERRFALRLMKAYSPTGVLISRHTRDLLRRYHRSGKLATRIATRQVDDFLVTLSLQERALYEAVEDYISASYNRAARKERNAVGFVMTIYRRRIASSFHALASTLQNRLASLEGRGSLVPPSEEDLPEDPLEEKIVEVEDAEAMLTQSLEREEEDEIRALLAETHMLPMDTKVRSLLRVLRSLEEQGYGQVIVFTQYTDSLDFLRESLSRFCKDPSWILCFSGRGGERWNNGRWEGISRDMTKELFREGSARYLLCTDAAAEGLNFQFCGALVNYDMPWNPMKVEQRIGRIDRLGQRFETIRIVNLLYAETVEADIYQALRERIGLFSSFVGNLQPILSKLPRRFKDLALSGGSQSMVRDKVLSQLESDIREQEAADFDLDELCLEELDMPDRPSPLYDLPWLNGVLTNPALLPCGYKAQVLAGGKDYKYSMPGRGEVIRVTTDPEYYEAHAESVELWSPGSPAFPWEES